MEATHKCETSGFVYCFPGYYLFTLNHVVMVQHSAHGPSNSCILFPLTSHPLQTLDSCLCLQLLRPEWCRSWHDTSPNPSPLKIPIVVLKVHLSESQKNFNSPLPVLYHNHMLIVSGILCLSQFSKLPASDFVSTDTEKMRPSWGQRDSLSHLSSILHFKKKNVISLRYAALTTLVSWLRIEPVALVMGAWSLSPWTSREVPQFTFFVLLWLHFCQEPRTGWRPLSLCSLLVL